MKHGDLVSIIYGYSPDPNDRNRTEIVAEPGLYLQRVVDGRVEVMTTDHRIVICSETRLKVRCPVDNLAYDMLRHELFPDLQPQAA